MISKIIEFYKRTYGEEYEPKKLDSRVKLQKLVFYYSECGIYFGNDYGYEWNQYGPYSEQLADEMSSMDDIVQIYNISKDECDVIEKLNDFIMKRIHRTYNSRFLMECIVSMQYLNFFNFGLGKKGLLELVQNKKPHLNDVVLNDEVYNFLFEL